MISVACNGVGGEEPDDGCLKCEVNSFGYVRIISLISARFLFTDGRILTYMYLHLLQGTR